MILSTFSYEQLLHTMQNAARILKERCEGYIYHNSDSVLKKAKKGGFSRVFSCEIEKQRYYQKFFSHCEGKNERNYATSVITVLLHNNRKYVITYNPMALRMSFIESKIRIFTEHYLNRYFERNNFESDGLELHEKVQVILESNTSVVPASIDDNVIRRYGEPSLQMNFLNGGERLCECVYLEGGDISIVESYGQVSVWRTFISKEMLFDSQKDDFYYHEAQDVIGLVNKH